jgi:hypothetical protein
MKINAWEDSPLSDLSQTTWIFFGRLVSCRFFSVFRHGLHEKQAFAIKT